MCQNVDHGAIIGFWLEIQRNPIFPSKCRENQGNAIEMLRKSEYLGFRWIFVIFIEPEAHFSPMCLQSALTSTVLTFVRKLKLLSKEQRLYFSYK